MELAVVGRYRLLARIGAGGMGEVHRAWDERLGREVAVKMLPEALVVDAGRLRRFAQEARAAAALSHPNIVAVHDVGEQDGRPFLVTELLIGETLRERIRSGTLTVRAAADAATQIARGLAAAHEKGIVHRDLKPDNLFVTADGTVKILDFGLGKLLQPAAGGPSQAPTETGVVVGTAGYMAPEQIRLEPVDARADIFAFGCVLYEMLSLAPLSALVRAELARSRADAGDLPGARQARRDLLGEWSEADEDLPLLQEARREQAWLEAEPRGERP